MKRTLILIAFDSRYHELAKDIKYNKGGILKAAVSYLRILKSDQIKKQKFEDKCRAQEIQKRKLIMKIQVISFQFEGLISVFYKKEYEKDNIKLLASMNKSKMS